MDQHVFKKNNFVAIILPLIIAVIILVAYFKITDLPPWILVAFLIPVFMIIHGQRTKVIIGDGLLRYEQVFRDEEVLLKDVAQIITREVEIIVDRNEHSQPRDGFSIDTNQVNQEREVQKVVYVLDESGRTFFSFPASLISRKDRTRFQEAVTTINPDIRVA